jgi:uncharacterized membrane protein YphA (DoxX/SURF4 family)
MTLTKKTKILYWIVTILFALLMLGSGIPDILSDPIAVKGMHEDLGYPLYFLPFIGMAKALGAIAILIPGFPRIKEWAYAGLFFDLIAAMYSIMAAGKPASDWGPMVFPIALAVAAYGLYHKKIKEENT